MAWKYIVALAGALAANCAAAADYSTQPELIASAPERSRFFTWEGEVAREDFLLGADRQAPLVIHLHGCAGIHPYSDLSFIRALREKSINVVAPDFLARGDATTSCPSGRAEPMGHPETSNPRRIAARRLEMERVIAWARENGFQRIWVTGHSEGGRVVQGVRAGVSGVIAIGMDCKNTAFWQPNPGNKVHVFVSHRDPWLGWPGAPVRGCGSPWDSSTMHWTNEPSHEPLADPAWKDEYLRLILDEPS